MFKRSRPVPPEYDEAVQADWDQYSDDQLADRYGTATADDKRKISDVFLRRTGQKRKS